MRLSIKLLLIFINLLLYWGSANAQTQWNSAFTPIPGTGDDVIISENIVEIPYGQVVEIASLGITGKKNDIGKLIVNGTLIIHGDLTMIDNFTAFEMGSSAIVIVDGNFAAENKITIQLDSYLIVRGDFTKSGAEGQGSLEVVADIDSPAHIYIFGETSGWDSSFTTCDDYASTDGNLSSADCDYGTLPNFIENLDDLPGFVTELLGCDNTSTPSFWGSISSNSPIGDGGNIQLTGTGANVNWQHTIKHYTWTGPNNYFFQATEYTDMNVVISNASELNEGYYYYSCYSEVGCYTKDSVYVEIGCVPENSPTWNGISGKPHSNGTRRTGETISLFANAQSSPSWAYKPVAYFWTGPNDFSASTQNPTLNNVNTSMSGYYTCTATNTAGCSITDSTYVLVSDCGFSSGYYSRDNYAGNWSDKSSWGVSDNSLQTPPPYDPNSSQTITINGYITLNGSLRLSGSQQYICDTLVVDGIFFADNPTLTIGPNGVLIVLDDYIGTSGSIKNEGQVVFAGEVQNPDSWSVISNAGGTTYILDPDPVGQMPEYSDLDDLKNDQDLYNFYISLVGGVPPSADCKDLTIYLNASGQASIQTADVHDGPLKANLTYTLSQSDFDCSDLGKKTITLTATNSGGLSDECTTEVTVKDDIAPIINCPPSSIASCIKDIPLPATTLAEFIALGGTVSDNCTTNDNLIFSWKDDVTDKKDAINLCEVVRTYTITDESDNVASCTQTFTITDNTNPAFLDRPADIIDFTENHCEKVMSIAAPDSIRDACLYGDTIVYHSYTVEGQPPVSEAGDIVDVAFPKGTTIITWSFEDECGNIATYEQAITIVDKTPPTASRPADQNLDAEGRCSAFLKDYASLLTDLSDNCDNNPTVTQRPAVDTEVFTNTEVWLIYADENGNRDSCSFMVNLTNLAPLDISEMIYDENQSGIGAIGSGQKPFITSTHPYEIDADEITPEDYTYTWLVLDQSGTDVEPDISYPDSNPRNAVIAFSETHFTEGDFYTIQVIKEQLTGNCSAVFELDIAVQQTDFNSGVLPLGPTCQDGGTGIPTVVFWDVDFTGGVEPYAFEFSISDGTEGCTGQVSNLFTDDSESIVHTENCDGTYAVAITKAPGEPAVQIAFTFVSEAGVDKDFNLTIQSATDQFSITKQTIHTDESDNITLWGVPNTSDIQTN